MATKGAKPCDAVSTAEDFKPYQRKELDLVN